MSEALALFDFASGEVSADVVELKRTLPGFSNPYEAFDRATTEFARLLRANVKITEKLLSEVTTQAYGTTEESGTWTIQSAYNALEAALVRRLLELRHDDPLMLQDTTALLPTQRRRSETKEQLQQFSTPPEEAALAAALGCITAADHVLEPSCGTGILAAFARVYRAQLTLNELDTERAHAAASALRTTCSSHDAGTIATRFEGDRPTVVLMNPPFSSDGYSTGTDVGLTHVQEAFTVLRDGGRLIAILGEFQHPEIKPAIWSWVKERGGSIRYAHIVERKAFHRMGTDFATAIVVLDKAPDLDLESSSTTPSDVITLFDGRPELPRLAVAGGATVASVSVLDPGTTKSIKGPNWTPIFDEDVAPLEYQRNTNRQIEAVGAHATFVPSLLIDGAQSHPTALIESSTLAHIDGPMPSVDVLLPTRILRDNLLSDAQLETIVYTAQAHDASFSLVNHFTDTDGAYKTELIEGVRRGMMIGHGTGFGKGRTIAGSILANVLAGRTKAIWFSESQALFEDASRDWKAIAGERHVNAIVNLSAFGPNDIIPMAHGILFATYATGRSGKKQKSRARIEQLLEWVGASDVTIVFDESHNLANAIAGKGDQGKTTASQQGQFALDLQRKLPNARIVYTSATSASKIDAFAYAPRLGLWSTTSSFKSREQFLEDMEQGGLGAMEMIARDLKALGLYVSSSLSLDGVTYERLEHPLTDEQIEQYNAIAEAWRVIYRNVDKALEATNGGSKNRRAARAALEMGRIRSLQALVTSQKLPTVIAHMQGALDAGHSLVVQLTNTYEAQQERALDAMDDATDLDLLDLSPRETIIGFLERAFPTGQYREVETPEGVQSVPVTDDSGRQIENPEMVVLREELTEKVRAMVCPDGPLEILLDTFGIDVVAEVTGRGRRVVRTIVDGKLQRIIEARPANAALAETAAFMSGKKRILIFSEAAGGTGRSYHAALDCGNQQKRYHYLLQTGWRSDRAIQGLGRTHRTFQACAPHWILCTSDVPGERRFLSTIAKRLEQLGACTKGQRDAVGTGLFSSDDNLETPFGTRAVKALLHSVASDEFDGLDYERWVDQTNLKLFDHEGKEKIDEIPVHRFLNKMLACDIDVQGMLITRLIEVLDEVIEVAKAQGEYDFGIRPLPGLEIAVSACRPLFSEADTGATAMLQTLAVTRKTEPKVFGTTLANVRKARAHYGTNCAGFAKDDEGIYGYYRLASSSSKDVSFTIVRPSGSRVVDYRPYGRDYDNFDEARADWDAELEQLDSTYIATEYFVTGTMLPIYGRLPSKNARIYRYTTTDGTRYIGRRIASDQLASVLAAFGIEHVHTPAQLIESLDEGATVRFQRNFAIKRCRLNGNVRYELLVPKHFVYSHGKVFTDLGVVRERVSYVNRFFVPHAQLTTVVQHMLKTEGLQLIEGQAA